jgi:hypothetical protein
MWEHLTYCVYVCEHLHSWMHVCGNGRELTAITGVQMQSAFVSFCIIGIDVSWSQMRSWTTNWIGKLIIKINDGQMMGSRLATAIEGAWSQRNKISGKVVRGVCIAGRNDSTSGRIYPWFGQFILEVAFTSLIVWEAFHSQSFRFLRCLFQGV